MPFVCPLEQCHRCYKRKGDLKVHMVKKHTVAQRAAHPEVMKTRSSAEGKPYVCFYPACANTFGYRRARGLRRHLQRKHAKRFGSLSCAAEVEALFGLVSLRR